MLRLRPGSLCMIPIVVQLLCRATVAQQPGFSQIEVHDPSSSRYVPMTPIAPRAGTFGTLSPGFYGSGFYPYYPSYYAYGPALGPYFGPIPYGGILPPLWIPPGALFGPQAVQRFIGADNPPQFVVPQTRVPPKQAGFGVLASNPPLAKAAQKPRATNADSRARSQRFIVLGDGYFAKQAYSDASQRYKLAVQAAPDMADGYFRQGLALVALGHYDAAARSLKRGLTLEPNWAATDFRLSTLYADNGLAKAAHIEALAQAALRAPSSDVLFLLGVMLYFDGQPARAKPFLVRSRELAAGDDAHLDGFLRKVAPAAPADQAPAPALDDDGDAAARKEGSKPVIVPVATRPATPNDAPPAAAAAPFSKMPSASAAPAKGPANPAPGLPPRLPTPGRAAIAPARDL
jgi:tetratricopeptide (TPR) repeat protein